jgi:hypothetical protein
MYRQKETTPSRQANRVAHKSNHRLSQEEWNALWMRDGWILVAMFGVLFAAMAGVI